MNKTIWIAWLQGWDKVSSLQNKCLQSWKHYNPDWEVKIIDNTNIFDYIPEIKTDLPGLDTNPVHSSDIYRTYLVKKYGGIWVDSTCFCNKPLDDWLPPGPFMYSNPSPDRMIADWFIKEDHPESVLMSKWLSEVITFWKWRIRFTDQQEFRQWIAWHHYSFQVTYEKYPEVKQIWDNVNKIECTTSKSLGPHLFIPYEVSGSHRPSKQIKDRIHSKVDGCYKLTRKNKVLAGSAVDYLLRTI